MKSSYACSLLLAIPLTGCVVVTPVAIYLQNTSGQPIAARLHYREWVHPSDTVHLRYQTYFAQGLRYAPVLLRPSQRTRQQLTATLPVSTTDTAATFTLPPHSTVLLYATFAHGGPFELPRDARLYFQPAGAPPGFLDEERFKQGGHFQRGGGFWYTFP